MCAVQGIDAIQDGITFRKYSRKPAAETTNVAGFTNTNFKEGY
jgi:hypothetical protein